MPVGDVISLTAELDRWNLCAPRMLVLSFALAAIGVTVLLLVGMERWNRDLESWFLD